MSDPFDEAIDTLHSIRDENDDAPITITETSEENDTVSVIYREAPADSRFMKDLLTQLASATGEDGSPRPLR